MIRLFPMFITGILCNVIVVLIIPRISLIWILCMSVLSLPLACHSFVLSFSHRSASGALITACAAIFFALIDPNATYWAFGFPSAIFSVFGADFVFSAGTIFVARIVLPHEQSLAGALFQTMTQVSSLFLWGFMFNEIDGVCHPSWVQR